MRTHYQALDIVLMDVQMPALDGNEATRRIRGELQIQSLPIVALTAGALVGERQRALEAGMNDFISKPFDPPVLIRKVRKLVEQSRGQPVPMIIPEAESARLTTNGLLSPSIDASVVHQMFGGDLALFKSLLARVLRDFSDLALPVSVSPENPTTLSELKGRTHKLKGSAGVIGATEIMRLAGEVEAAIEESRAVDVVEGILRELASALTTLREEADLMAKAEGQPDADIGTTLTRKEKIVPADIDELCALLESQNLAAIDRFSFLSPSLSDLIGPVRFDRLREAVDNLDFQLGAELLRQALLAEGTQAIRA